MAITNITEALDALKTLAEGLPAAVEVDSTLSVEGAAADAKAVGEALEVPVIDLDEFDTDEYSTSLDYGAQSSCNLDETQAARFRAFRNGQLIAVRKTYDRTTYTGIGNIQVLNDSVEFFCVCASSYSGYFIAGTMPAGSNTMELLASSIAPLFHLHSPEDIVSGMFQGQIYAHRHSSYQNPFASLIRNTMIMPVGFEEYIPTAIAEGEICWIHE